MTPFEVIVAVDDDGGIGRDGGLPWRLPGDMAHFKDVTTTVPREGVRNAVVMGRRTWESIPEKFRPLSARLNVVLTRNPDLALPEGVLRADSLRQAIDTAAGAVDAGTVFVIGGASLYREAIGLPGCRKVHLTRIEGRFDCDTLFPRLDLDGTFRIDGTPEPREENGIRYSFSVLVRW